MPSFVGLLGLWWALAHATVDQEVLVVAAASDLQFSIPALREAFESEHPEISLRAVTGSSGVFAAQIERGAPMDVFLSADVGYVDHLVGAGVLDEPFRYGRGRLVLYARPGLPAAADKALALAHLTDPRVLHIALAHPVHAPYGRAARAALDSTQLWPLIHHKVVVADSAAQAAQFIATGNVDVAFLPLAFVLVAPLRDQGSWSEVPPQTYPPLVQGGGLVVTSPRHAAARAFRSFLLSRRAQAILATAGFSPADDRSSPSPIDLPSPPSRSSSSPSSSTTTPSTSSSGVSPQPPSRSPQDGRTDSVFRAQGEPAPRALPGSRP
jgi:molybdate transport system substrate-binding protein